MRLVLRTPVYYWNSGKRAPARGAVFSLSSIGVRLKVRRNFKGVTAVGTEGWITVSFPGHPKLNGSDQWTFHSKYLSRETDGITGFRVGDVILDSLASHLKARHHIGTIERLFVLGQAQVRFEQLNNPDTHNGSFVRGIQHLSIMVPCIEDGYLCAGDVVRASGKQSPGTIQRIFKNGLAEVVFTGGNQKMLLLHTKSLINPNKTRMVPTSPQDSVLLEGRGNHVEY